MTSLAKCTRLAELKMYHCEFSQPTVFANLPKSITKLELYDCTFVGGFDWSFLADSNLQELDMQVVRGVDGSQLGDALAIHLKTKGLDKLRLSTGGFTDETLAAVGMEIGRTKRLEIVEYLNEASLELIARVLKSPNSEMKDNEDNFIETILGPD